MKTTTQVNVIIYLHYLHIYSCGDPFQNRFQLQEAFTMSTCIWYIRHILTCESY